MMPEQQDLLLKAKESLDAAKLLRDSGHPGFAAARQNTFFPFFMLREPRRTLS